MDEETPQSPALLINPITTNNAPANNVNNVNNASGANLLKAEDHVHLTNHTIGASPGTASDSSSRPQRRRNKPSLSCETCTVSHN